ncbi:hypothetical protein BDY21DRAFT_410079 [Lineolata rhizophorae]|uniref:Uncharacterized protein n=1 Tax=Lineolata rhizophorae TaxID=578093 RepID=A0A6A6P5K9_9PEZI|nr:hypothetical protein BDY21DRAFT_410079 [Lineolata rhizophorae]
MSSWMDRVALAAANIPDEDEELELIIAEENGSSSWHDRVALAAANILDEDEELEMIIAEENANNSRNRHGAVAAPVIADSATAVSAVTDPSASAVGLVADSSAYNIGTIASSDVAAVGPIADSSDGYANTDFEYDNGTSVENDVICVQMENHVSRFIWRSMENGELTPDASMPRPRRPYEDITLSPEEYPFKSRLSVELDANGNGLWHGHTVCHYQGTSKIRTYFEKKEMSPGTRAYNMSATPTGRNKEVNMAEYFYDAPLNPGHQLATLPSPGAAAPPPSPLPMATRPRSSSSPAILPTGGFKPYAEISSGDMSALSDDPEERAVEDETAATSEGRGAATTPASDEVASSKKCWLAKVSAFEFPDEEEELGMIIEEEKARTKETSAGEPQSTTSGSEVDRSDQGSSRSTTGPSENTGETSASEESPKNSDLPGLPEDADDDLWCTIARDEGNAPLSSEHHGSTHGGKPDGISGAASTPEAALNDDPLEGIPGSFSVEDGPEELTKYDDTIIIWEPVQHSWIILKDQDLDVAGGKHQGQQPGLLVPGEPIEAIKVATTQERGPEVKSSSAEQQETGGHDITPNEFLPAPQTQANTGGEPTVGTPKEYNSSFQFSVRGVGQTVTRMERATNKLKKGVANVSRWPKKLKGQLKKLKTGSSS